MNNEPKFTREERDLLQRKVAVLKQGLSAIKGMGGQTLLGPDSKHCMGDDAPRYHEMGANAAFEQAANIAANYLAREEETT